ncbi:MAG TPA: ABC transporter substrate-binding protein [Blastocatellia bacterium]|jgi:ABC-type branched-subunit amino acid transport system substrate-binding protein|nr:ABC transporter substrate-binding protein [Blastocatellia bacterium]
MNRSSHRLIVARAALGALVFCWLVLSPRAGAQTTDELTPQEKRGKQIYQKGEGEGGEIRAVLGASALELPATSFTCANCHGLRGEGSKEGGLQPPPLDWATLSGWQTSPLTGRKRPPYEDRTLARAISVGLDSSGSKLHPAMPFYKMSPPQMEDLIAYLKKIGKAADRDEGITDDSIKVGAALPLTGPLAQIGDDIRSALAAYFNEVNDKGGIYGRKLRLVVEDSRGEATATLDATRRLVERAGVFALVGTFEPRGSEATNSFLKDSEVPLVGPVTLSPSLPSVPNRFVFYLLPSFTDQARSLIDFLGSEETRPKGRPASRVAVVHSSTGFDKDALEGIKAQAGLYSISIVSDQEFEPGRVQMESIMGALAASKPDYVFFLGAADDFVAFGKEMERAKLGAGLLSSAVMVGRGAFNLPPEIASRTYLSFPSSLPGKDDFSEFLAVMQKAGVNIRNAAFQTVAFGAAKVLVEATKNSRKELSRAALVNSLEQLQNFRTGVLPPVTFGPNRRVGAVGSYVVGIDLANRQYVPLGDRLSPRGNHH